MGAFFVSMIMGSGGPKTRGEALAERDRCKEECREREREHKRLTSPGYGVIDKMKGGARNAM